MTVMPVLHGDSALSLLAEGYLFGHSRFERLSTDAFRCRVMGHRTLVMRGQDAARFFYEDGRFTRRRAPARSVSHSPPDDTSVQSLDHTPHRERKLRFLEVLDVDGRAGLSRCFGIEWARAHDRWRQQRSVVLLDEFSTVLTGTGLRWLGIDAPADVVAARTAELTAEIDGAGSFGPRHRHGRRRGREIQEWARRLVADARRESGDGPPTPLRAVADWRDEDGSLLPEQTAAAEVLNLLRPITAVGRFVVFAALALHLHPQWRDRLLSEPTTRMAFAAEVRRTTPYLPSVEARALERTSWAGIPIQRGTRVRLDLFATNRHPAQWQDAWRFDPARFLGREDPRRVVAQGAGEIVQGHRCPGEPATADILQDALALLAQDTWSIPAVDTRVDLRRMPAVPGRAGVFARLAGG